MPGVLHQLFSPNGGQVHMDADRRPMVSKPKGMVREMCSIKAGVKGFVPFFDLNFRFQKSGVPRKATSPLGERMRLTLKLFM